jgi:outer membrane receptor for monomeric catechols
VSGVNVATGFGVFDYFVVRGFDSLSSGLVLTDGIAEPESTFYPLYNVRQVEVLKGRRHDEVLATAQEATGLRPAKNLAAREGDQVGAF